MRSSLLFSILILLLFTATNCTPSTDNPTDPEFADSLQARVAPLVGVWKLTQRQSPGIAGQGLWSAASPAGQTLTLQNNGVVGGTAFPQATGFEFYDSHTIKMFDASQPPDFRLFMYDFSTAGAMILYIRPPNGTTFCIEGCGGYRFEK